MSNNSIEFPKDCCLECCAKRMSEEVAAGKFPT